MVNYSPWGLKELDRIEQVAHWGVPGGSDVKEAACSAEDPGLIPGLG